MKRRIHQNIWGNWNGYEGTRKVIEFGTDEIDAREWLGFVSITPKERQVLTDIVGSEYNSDNPVDYPIWLDYVIDSKSRGGVLTSLQKKGLVTVTIVPKAESDNRLAGISDSTISITQKGFDALSIS